MRPRVIEIGQGEIQSRQGPSDFLEKTRRAFGDLGQRRSLEIGHQPRPPGPGRLLIKEQEDLPISSGDHPWDELRQRARREVQQDRDLALQPLAVRAGRRDLEDESSTVVGPKSEVVIGESDQGFGADMESPGLGGEVLRPIGGESRRWVPSVQPSPTARGPNSVIRPILLG